jgi:hypothetical protein
MGNLMTTLNIFPAEKKTFIRERESKTFRVWTYFLGKVGNF